MFQTGTFARVNCAWINLVDWTRKRRVVRLIESQAIISYWYGRTRGFLSYLYCSRILCALWLCTHSHTVSVSDLSFSLLPVSRYSWTCFMDTLASRWQPIILKYQPSLIILAIEVVLYEHQIKQGLRSVIEIHTMSVFGHNGRVEADGC